MDHTFTIHITEGWFRLAVVCVPVLLYLIFVQIACNKNKRSSYKEDIFLIALFSFVQTLLASMALAGAVAVIWWIADGFMKGAA